VNSSHDLSKNERSKPGMIPTRAYSPDVLQ
jgi:hypothetical protein